MRELLAGKLWIGNAHDIRPATAGVTDDVRAVVDLALDEPPANLPRDMIYVRVPLEDSGSNTDSTVRFALSIIVRLLKSQMPTLVCCSVGMSRSPAIACAALAIERQEAPDEVLRSVLAGVPHDISPSLWEHVRAAVE